MTLIRPPLRSLQLRNEKCMFTEECVIFEEDCFQDLYRYSQETVKQQVFKLVCSIVQELQINSLKATVIKAGVINDRVRGIADYRQKRIALSKQTAFGLLNENKEKFNESLAILRHELLHFQDFEKILDARQVPLGPDTLAGFGYWTEFYASFSTFSTFEDEKLYKSCQLIFQNENATVDEKLYYCSRLIGYYLHPQHQNVCDELVSQYLNTSRLKTVCTQLLEYVRRYPLLSLDDLNKTKAAMSDLLSNQILCDAYEPITQADIIAKIKRRGN